MRHPFSGLCVAVLISVSVAVVAQDNADSHQSSADQQRNATDIARILGLSDSINDIRQLHARNGCSSPVTLEEMAIRQDIVETILGGSLDVEGVMAELENERSQLFELRAALTARRDRSVGLLNVANIITGTGVGIAVNALQLSDSTAKVGDNIGIASGIGSTVLSVMGLHRQHGPLHSIGRLPNMLAPLFGRAAVLNTYYPPAVLEYLHSTPVSEDTESGSRLDQLMAEWRREGRIGPTGALKTDQQIARLTSSLDTKKKLSIDDISDRIAMLSDVIGRVGLMKRDLAKLMMSLKKGCVGQ
jgi:hypothetical protein